MVVFTKKVNAPTQSGKEMEKLLGVLSRKDDMAFDDVLAVLQNHCQWLADEIEHQVSEEEKRWTKHGNARQLK